MRRNVLFHALLYLITIPSTSVSQWTPQRTGSWDGSEYPDLYLSAVSEDVCWGLRWESSTVLRTTDGGTTWNVSTIPGAAGLKGSCIKAVSQEIAWAAAWWPLANTTSGGVFKTTDGGATWVQQPVFTRFGDFPDVVHFFDDSTGVCIGDSRTFGGNWEIYTSSDGGNHWDAVPSADIPLPVEGELGFPGGYKAVGNRLWFVTWSGSLYRTSDRGHAWGAARNVGSGIFGVDFTDSLNGLATSGLLKRTTDGGVTWAPSNPANYPSGLTAGYLCVVPGSRGSFVIGAHSNYGSGTALTIDYGSTWSRIDRAPHGITRFASPSVGWSAGMGDTVYKWIGGSLTPATAIRVSASLIDLLNVRVGEVSDTGHVTVTNWGMNALSIASITHSAAEFSLEGLPSLPATVQPAESDQLILRVTFHPVQQGVSIFDSILIASNDSRNPFLMVSLRGRGSAPVVAAASDSAYGLSVTGGDLRLWKINLGTGQATNISTLSPEPPPDVQGLAIRPSEGKIYASHSTSTETVFYRISPVGGDIEYAGSASLGGIRGIYFTEGDTLILSDTTGRLLGMTTLGSAPYRIDSTRIAIYSFARSPTTGQLWGVSQYGLYEIDPLTWSKTLTGSLPGIFRPSITTGRFGTLFGLFDGDLYTLDRLTGNTTLIGSTGVSGLRGIVMRTSTVNDVEAGNPAVPESFVLRQNYPNPFNPTTTLEFDLPVKSNVELMIYDLLGRLVTTLADEVVPAGRHSRLFNGAGLASGVYYVRLRAGSFVSTKILLLLR